MQATAYVYIANKVSPNVTTFPAPADYTNCNNTFLFSNFIKPGYSPAANYT